MPFNKVNLDDFTANFDANLKAFEEEGVSLSRPVLAEGYYPAFLKSITSRFGITNKVNKSNPKGEDKAWFSLQASFELDSAIARESVKQDNNPVVYTANETTFLPQFFNLSEYGFSQEGNGQFWGLIGSILAQVDLATLVEKDGTKSYLIKGEILQAIFNDKYKEEVVRLYTLAQAGESISDDEKKNNPLLVPAILADLLITNISELLTQDTATSACAVLVARRKNEQNGELQHYAKGFILGSDVEKYQDELLV